MTTQERKQLNEIIASLEAIQAEAPTKTTYSRGATGASLSYRLLDDIRKLKEMIGNGESETTA